MKIKYLSLVVVLSLFLACTNNQDTNTEQSDSLEQSNTEANVEDEEQPVLVDYKTPNIAYVKSDKLYFYYPDNAEIKLLSDEVDTVFSCDFDKDNNILYYTVVRAGILWLRKAEFPGDGTVNIADIGSFNVKKDDYFTETYGERGRFKFVNGKIYIEHGFSWDSYSFSKMSVISCSGDDKVKSVDWNYEVFDPDFDPDNFDLDKQFQTKDNNLFYIGGGDAVNMSNNLTFESEEEEEEIEFCNFEFSSDKSKLLFGVILFYGDLAHGPYCVADIDGNNQKELLKDGMSSIYKPLWLNNKLVFRKVLEDEEGDYFERLCITNPENNDIITIDDDVCYFSVK